MPKKSENPVIDRTILWNNVLQHLLEEMEENPPLGAYYDRSLKSLIRKIIGAEASGLTKAEQEKLMGEVFDYVCSESMIEAMLGDPGVSEIMINGADNVYKEINGEIMLTDTKFNDNNQVRFLINHIINPLGRFINNKVPMIDSHLPDGSRVNVVIPPIVKQGPTISIRKFLKHIFTMKELLALDSINEKMAEFLILCIKARLNILVAGNTSSGKTTLLNILSGAIPEGERIVTIEDSLELQLTQPHVLSLEARPADNEGVGLVTIRDLVRNTLRMRPDRIIVGEVRGAEALDMLQAMNTGHDGSLTTIHSNSARDGLARLETMCLMAGLDMPVTAIRKQMASALDLIIYLNRFPDGTRKVTQITEVIGMEGEVITTTDLYLFKQTGVNPKGQPVGSFQPTGLRPMFAQKISNTGLGLPAYLFIP
jgi:pilus assembly protein CpaF